MNNAKNRNTATIDAKKYQFSIILFVGDESLPGLPSTLTVEHVRFIPFVKYHIVTLWLTDYNSVELHIGVGLSSTEWNILSLVGMKPGHKGSTAILVNAHTCDDDGVGHIHLPIEAGTIVVSTEYFQYILAVCSRELRLAYPHIQDSKKKQNYLLHI